MKHLKHLRGCSTLKEGPSLFKWYIMFYVDFSIGLVKKFWFLKKKKFFIGCYRQRRPYWKKTTILISTRTPHRIKIFTWFKLHNDYELIFCVYTDRISFILIRKKIRTFWNFNTSQRRQFFIFFIKTDIFFSINVIKKWLCINIHLHLNYNSTKFQSSRLKISMRSRGN